MFYQNYRFSKDIAFSNYRKDKIPTPSDSEGFASRKWESVTSFRDDPYPGTPVLDATIDPNAYFLKSVNSARGGTLLDNGHPFYKVEHWSDFNYYKGLYVPRGDGYPSDQRYAGPYFPGPAWQPIAPMLFPVHRILFDTQGKPTYGPPAGAVGYPALTNNDLQAIGQEYFSKTALNVPAWSGLTSLSELREGLPSLPGHFLNGNLRNSIAASRRDFGKPLWKKFGQESTNVNFGWLPLVSDVMAFAKALARIDYEMRELQRNSGKPIRRKRASEWVVNKSTQDLNPVNTYHVLAVPDNLFNKRGLVSTSSANSVDIGMYPQGRLEQTDSRRDWYSASFSYRYTGSAIPDFSEKVRYLFRPDLTVGQLYAAAPWSWLVDWFVSLSSTLLSNQLIADTNLIQNYGYVMAERERRNTVTVSPGSLNGYPNWWPPLPTTQMTLGTTEKFRVRGNPFGFNVNLNNLSIRQLGILAGLGLAKLD